MDTQLYHSTVMPARQHQWPRGNAWMDASSWLEMPVACLPLTRLPVVIAAGLQCLRRGRQRLGVPGAAAVTDSLSPACHTVELATVVQQCALSTAKLQLIMIWSVRLDWRGTHRPCRLSVLEKRSGSSNSSPLTEVRNSSCRYVVFIESRAEAGHAQRKSTTVSTSVRAAAHDQQQQMVCLQQQQPADVVFVVADRLERSMGCLKRRRTTSFVPGTITRSRRRSRSVHYRNRLGCKQQWAACGGLQDLQYNQTAHLSPTCSHLCCGSLAAAPGKQSRAAEP